MSSARIVGLIVAAGYSSRMGTFKPLLPLGGKTVIEVAVDSLRMAGVADIRIVVGYRAAELYPVLDQLQVDIIENPKYSQGMFSSVVAGLKTFAGDAEAFFLLPGDTPVIRRHSIKDVVREYRKTNAAVVYPVFNGERGHPPLINATCFDRILSGDGADGLRGILNEYEADSVDVPVADQGILLDMDTMEDFNQLTRFYLRRHIPTYDECLAILNKHQDDNRVLQHGHMVAEIGKSLASHLNCAGLSLSTELVYTGGLLHDLGKGKPNHPKRGERLLRCNGFSELSSIVASHMDMELKPECAIDEAALVFLADKLVQGTRRVSLSERFTPALDRFAGNREIIDAISRRKRTAEVIWNQAASILGMHLDEIVFSANNP